MLITSEFWRQNGNDDVEILGSLASSGRLLAAKINAAYIDVGLPDGLLYAREHYGE